MPAADRPRCCAAYCQGPATHYVHEVAYENWHRVTDARGPEVYMIVYCGEHAPAEAKLIPEDATKET